MGDYPLIKENGYSYFETGGDRPKIVLLHGLLGALSNFQGLIDHFKDDYNVLVPILPLFEISLRSLSVVRLVDFVDDFLKFKKIDSFHILGNSLGGHIAQLYVLRYPGHVLSMTLTGSSGLFESAMGTTFPKRGSYEYMKQKTESVFYDPAIATKELVDDVYKTVNDLKKALCVVAIAKSAVRHNLEDKLHQIKIPTLLIWGIQDNVTPLWVGEKFNELIPNSELVKVDKCGHAPMMERPDLFNYALEDFLNRVNTGKYNLLKKESYILPL